LLGSGKNSFLFLLELFKEQAIEFIEALYLGQGNKEISPGISDEVLYLPIFMRLTRGNKGRVKKVVGTEGDKDLLFDAVFSFKNLLDGSFQIIPDNSMKNTSEELKGPPVSFKEGLLPLKGKG